MHMFYYKYISGLCVRPTLNIPHTPLTQEYTNGLLFD